MQPDPSKANNYKLYMARERYWRRCQLWHAARLACGDDTQFKAAWHSIAAAVSDRLAEEFGD